MLLFLGVTYFEATKGKLCSETGDIAIEDSTTCKEAAEELGYKFMTTEDYANWPKGCYLYYNRHLVRDAVWFNRHTHGKQLPNTRNICKGFVKGMSSTSFVTSMRFISYIQLQHQWII